MCVLLRPPSPACSTHQPSKPKPPPPTTHTQVYAAFRRIATTSGKGTQEERAAIIVDLLGEASQLEAAYLMRILQVSVCGCSVVPAVLCDRSVLAAPAVQAHGC